MTLEQERRIAELERNVESLRQVLFSKQAKHLQARTARTVVDGSGNYPESRSAYAFPIAFTDEIFTETAGTPTVTSTTHSASYQRIALTQPRYYYELGSEVMVVQVGALWYIIGCCDTTNPVVLGADCANCDADTTPAVFDVTLAGYQVLLSTYEDFTFSPFVVFNTQTDVLDMVNGKWVQNPLIPCQWDREVRHYTDGGVYSAQDEDTYPVAGDFHEWRMNLQKLADKWIASITWPLTYRTGTNVTDLSGEVSTTEKAATAPSKCDEEQVLSGWTLPQVHTDVPPYITGNGRFVTAFDLTGATLTLTPSSDPIPATTSSALVVQNLTAPIIDHTNVELDAGDTSWTQDKRMSLVSGDAGGNTISTISAPNVANGDSIHVRFLDGNVTLDHDSSHDFNTIDLGGSDLTSSADRTIELVKSNNSWFIDRSSSGGGAETSGNENEMLTDDGAGGITSESNLTFDGTTMAFVGSANALIGNVASGTNVDAADLTISVPVSTGNADPGAFVIQTTAKGGSGATPQTLTSTWRFVHNRLESLDPDDNTFIGENCGDSVTVGSALRNFGMGLNCLTNLTTGDDNTAIGINCLGTVSTGSRNVAIGARAGFAVTGPENVLIGKDAGDSINSGARNTCIGYDTGENITTGSSNIMIGEHVNAQVATASDQISIGNLITGNATEQHLTAAQGSVGIGTFAFPTGTENSCLVFADNAGDPTPAASTGLLYADAVGGTVTPKAIDESGNVAQLVPGKQTITLGAAATTFAATRKFVEITGDAGANTLATITGALAYEGSELFLLFTDALVTITDDNTHAANSIDLSAAFTSADDTVLHLIHDGTSWYEVSRSIN